MLRNHDLVGYSHYNFENFLRYILIYAISTVRRYNADRRIIIKI